MLIMFEILMTSLNKWNVTKTERQKLQHSYIVLALIIVLFAGIISLFNANFGHKVVFIALGSIAIFIVNSVIWNLLQSSIIEKLSTKPKRK